MKLFFLLFLLIVLGFGECSVCYSAAVRPEIKITRFDFGGKSWRIEGDMSKFDNSVPGTMVRSCRFIPETRMPIQTIILGEYKDKMRFVSIELSDGLVGVPELRDSLLRGALLWRERGNWLSLRHGATIDVFLRVFEHHGFLEPGMPERLLDEFSREAPVSPPLTPQFNLGTFFSDALAAIFSRLAF